MTKAIRGTALTLALALAGPALAETTWDLYAFTGPSHPITQRYMMFADEVKEATGGELVITVRPAGELPFKATEVIKATSTGQVQLAQGYQAFLSGAVPVAAVASLPFLVQSGDELKTVAPDIIAAADAEFEKEGVRTLFWHTWPVQNIFGAGEPVRSPADFAGRKIRSTDGNQAALLAALGSSSISLTTPEVPVAVERGVAEGYMTAAFNVLGAQWQDFTDWGYLCDVNIGGPEYLLMNVAAYEALPEEVRTALDGVAAGFGEKFTDLNLGDEADSLKKLEEHGVTLVTPTEAEMDEMTALMVPYWESWAADNGETAVQLLADIRAKLGK